MRATTICVLAVSTVALAFQANAETRAADGYVQLAQRGDGVKRGGGDAAPQAVRPDGGGSVGMRANRTDRGPRGDRIDRAPRVDRGERVDRGFRVGRGDRRVDRGDRVYRGDRGHRHRGDWRRRGVRHLWAPGIAFYYYGGYYYGDCDWLKRKAIATDSSYWWRRYRRCRWG